MDGNETRQGARKRQAGRTATGRLRAPETDDDREVAARLARIYRFLLLRCPSDPTGDPTREPMEAEL